MSIIYDTGLFLNQHLHKVAHCFGVPLLTIVTNTEVNMSRLSQLATFESAPVQDRRFNFLPLKCMTRTFFNHTLAMTVTAVADSVHLDRR